MEMVAKPGHRTRRHHSAQFKTQVVAACLEPGVSLSAVALANGLNANLLRQWVQAHRQAALGAFDSGLGDAAAKTLAATPTLVPVQVQAAANPGTGDIRVTLRRGQQVVEVTWPVSEAAACGRWLSELLR